MTAYYNEHDPQAAAWLRELIARGLIAPGDVDERDIRDVHPVDLIGYDQCHFFAGIGGWSLAARLADWPDDRPVWTGSCPCQPFSAAGRGGGHADARHLWPDFFRLIRERRPAIVFGEQVASALGRTWLGAVRADLETLAYAVGAADLCAAGVGAPHIRQRLWWVAESDRGQRDRIAGGQGRIGDGPPAGRIEGDGQPQRGREDVVLANGLGSGLEGHDARKVGNERPPAERGGSAGSLGDRDGEGRGECQERDGEPDAGREIQRGSDALRSSPWDDLIWLPCRDGKARPTQPGVFALVDGVSGRVGLLRGAGNAIVPQVAAAFMRAAAR